MEIVNPAQLQSIWLKEDGKTLCIIDQRHLPYRLVVEEIQTVAEMCTAIRDMHLRGAPLIGVAAGYGMYLACREAAKSSRPAYIQQAASLLLATRPTAVNLAWAVNRQQQALRAVRSEAQRVEIALDTARLIEEQDIETCRRIGQFGKTLIEEVFVRSADKRRPVNVLTHCNAGWLACVRYGTATAPVYAAHQAGIPVHVWVDETRPRNQGSRLTAWELAQAGVPHTVVADNTGGHLMQHGLVDLVIVGSDRTTRRGDVANKIGTYLKALAAHDNKVPFYVALPSSTIDWGIRDGLQEIPIERRDAREVQYVEGLLEEKLAQVLVVPFDSPAANYAFDVTPARLVTGLITEKGVCPATEEGILSLFPEEKKQA